MNSTQKHTVYVDIDDEITAVIEKIRGTHEHIVALVLPKRATVLQSIVNMKLLKRTADEAKKKVVLITSEAGLLPLAGAVGLHVAKTLQSKPAVPPSPAMPDDLANITEDNSLAASEADDIDASKPVGELAGLTPPDDDETIQVDNSEETSKSAVAAKKPPSKNKRLRIPNFNKFRLRLFLAGLILVLLIVGWYLAFRVWPTASIAVQTDTMALESELAFTARPNLEELDSQQSIVPAKIVELRKTDAEKAPATGQKNTGEKAKGQMTLSLADCSENQVNIPAGTGVSANDLTFITQEDVTLNSIQIGGSCQNENFPDFSSKTINVVAQKSGDQYNLNARSYNVAGFGNVDAAGSDMAGGTTKNVKVVSQADVDGAKQKLLERNNEAAVAELRQQLEQDGFIPLEETLNTGEPTVVASPNVGDEANEVSISSTIVYTIVGVRQADLRSLIEAKVAEDIDPSKQSILDDGLGEATFKVVSRAPGGDVRMSLQTVVTAGPQLDAEAIKQEIKGKKSSETEDIIKSRPGIKDVRVNYSPFWVASTPERAEKITINFEEPTEDSSEPSDESEDENTD